MTTWRAVVLAASLVAAGAQAETFDMATFEPPAGWTREALPGALRFTFVDPASRAFGTIVILASVASSGDAERDFAAAWQHTMQGVDAPAQRMTQRSAQGFPMVLGAAQTSEGGVTAATLVVTITAHQRSVTILARTSSKDLLAKMDALLRGLKLAPPAAAPAGGSVDDTVFVAPPGWKTTRSGDMIQLTDEVGGCTLLLLPPRPASGTLEENVDALYAQATAGWSRENTVGQGDSPYFRSLKGTSADGWDYMRVEGFVERDTPAGKLRALDLAFVAQLDGRVAKIAGTRAGPDAYSNMRSADLVTGKARCLDDDLSVDWPSFFLSLHFKSFSARKSGLAEKLVGKWWSSWTGGSMGYVFAANGRYDMIVGYQTFQRVDAATLRTTTTGLFPGSGSWKLDGNQLTLKPDAPDVRAATFGVRLEMVKELGVWSERLRLSSKDPPQRTLHRE